VSRQKPSRPLAVSAVVDGAQRLEPMAEHRALPSSELEQQRRARGRQLGEHCVERARDGVEAGRLAGAEMGARVDDEAVEPERRRPGELVGERAARLGEHGGIGRREIDEVGGVGEERQGPGRRAFGRESGELVLGESGRAPLAGALDEDLQRLAAELAAAREGACHAAGGRDVGSESGHDGPQSKLSLAAGRPPRDC
jgi:hypothetical protein